MNYKTLIIVDVQTDFYKTTGALYVSGGEKVVGKIENLIVTDQTINQVIFTVDWHTPEDKSFKKNGGGWDTHCVQYTQGASIPDSLIAACISRGFTSIDGSYKEGTEIDRFFISNTYDVFAKGDCPGEEEYGAFAENEVLENDETVFMLSSKSGDSCAYLGINNDVVVCGLAGDYCVKETAKNILTILKENDGAGKLMMWLPGIASIDGGKILNDWMKKEGVSSYEQL